MEGRTLPADAWLDTKCPDCGGPMFDWMGDDVCPKCGVKSQDEKPAEAHEHTSVFTARYNDGFSDWALLEFICGAVQEMHYAHNEHGIVQLTLEITTKSRSE